MSLLLPFTFGPRAQSEDLRALLEASISQAVPTCLLPWSSVSSDSNFIGLDDTRALNGVAIGCEDGTLFLLRNSHKRRRSPAGSLSIAVSDHLAAVPRSAGSRRSSGIGIRPNSPSPFQLTRSRVISAVSAEQAEAPKNYVDFDDEPEKLKDMLKGKGVKEKTVVDSIMSGVEKGINIEMRGDSPASSSPDNRSLKRKDKPRLLAATFSPASSSRSLSPPTPASSSLQMAPSMTDNVSLSLFAHIIPPRHGLGEAVASMKPLEGGLHIICLHRTGNLEIYSTRDGSCVGTASTEDGLFTPPSGAKTSTSLPAVWVWKTLRIASIEERTIILACGSPEVTSSTVQSHDATEGDSEQQTRIVAFEWRVAHAAGPGSQILRKIGDWALDGPAEGVDLQRAFDGRLVLIHIDPSRHLLSRSFTLSEEQADPQVETMDTSSNNHLPLPNPFKSLVSRSTEQIPETAKEQEMGQILLGEEVDCGAIALDGPLLGLLFSPSIESLRGLAWSDRELCAFEYSTNSLRNLFSHPLAGICDVRWIGTDDFTVLLSDRAELYTFTRVDANNDIVSSADQPDTASMMQPKLLLSGPLPISDASTIGPGGHVLCTRVKNGRRRIECLALDPSIPNAATPRTVWKARPQVRGSEENESRVTAMLPIRLDLIVLGYGDGRICRSNLPRMAVETTRNATEQASDIPLSAAVVRLHLVQSARTGEHLLVGGGDDGSVAIWALDSLKLLTRWTIFLTPLVHVIHVQEGRLRDCILCISQDGTIAIIALDGFQFMYLIPASIAVLEKICLGEDNLLLQYSDGRARLWDIKTGEFWRSMATDKVSDLLKQGGWTEWATGSTVPSSSSIMSTVPGIHRSLDAGATLVFNVEAFLKSQASPTLSQRGTASESSAVTKERIRTVLSVLLTPGLNEQIDASCREKFGVQLSGVSVGHTAHGSSVIYVKDGPRDSWSISPEVSAARASALLAVLQTLLQFEGIADDSISIFYAASLDHVVGDTFAAPSLPVLARQWLESTANELRHASRLLFDSGVARLTDGETAYLVDDWHRHLPSLQQDGVKESVRCALSLFICGSIAVEKYALLSTSYLTDIAKSIAYYLHDETSPHRALAIDLCSRGFPIWQQYVDAVEMLRALFTLATTTRKESISVHNVGLQARSAVLQIASSNTPLFMTTLSMDILQPRSVQHRKSVMQLVIFLIRKNPLVLYSNLPRLVEAVVKSLDPNSTASRDAVLDSATEILGHIVQTFPTVDFHMTSQRLAVGTSEGAVVMYDLKTATRLYVLEGHNKRTAACSFSPDGRRLVTVSLEECAVLVWKVGSSFTSFFNPGAPPRQGNSGSDPFKTLNFNVGEEANMTLAETLECVRFEWPSDRSVKLRIRESILTFST